MTLPKTTLFLALCSLGLAAVGCRQPHSASAADGTLQFVVRPLTELRGAVPRGSFEIRGIDNDEHARVGIGSSAARTLSIRLPAGAYSVAWQPSPAVSGAADAAAGADGAHRWPQIVVVSPESSSTVDVFGATRGTYNALASVRTRAL